MRSRIGTLTAGGKTGQRYESLICGVEEGLRPHEVVREFWGRFERSGAKNNSTRGKMFEYIICECLLAFGVSPIYFQSKFYRLDYDTYDLASWTKEGWPIIVSCKTSLRERWKQADLEGRLLKDRFPGARSYLVTLDEGEGKRLAERIKDRKAPGVDRVFLANQPEFDDFVKVMGSSGLESVEPIEPLKGTKLSA